MTLRHTIFTLLFLLAICVSQIAKAETVKESELNAKLDTAAEFLDEGSYDKALVIIDEVLAVAPSHPRGLKLYLRANKAKSASEKKAAEARREVDSARALAEVDEAAKIPKKVITDEPPMKFKNLPPEGLSQEMKELLNQRISLNVIDADLSYIFTLLFTTTGINIVADRSMLADKRLDIHVENAKFIDLLEYIALNSGVTYTVNDSGIWISTPSQPQLQIRIFRLRYGVTRTGEAFRENATSTNANSTSGIGPTSPFGSNTNRNYNPNSNTRSNFNPYRRIRKADEGNTATEDVPLDMKIDYSATDDAFRNQMMSTIGRMMQMRADQSRSQAPGNSNQPNSNANDPNAQNGRNSGDTDMEKLLEWVSGWSGSLAWPDGSTWRFDAKTNALIVVSTPEMLEKVQSLIEEFDVPPIQVNIRTRFITVKEQTGMQWGIQGLLESALGQGGDGTNNRTQIDPGAGWNLNVPSGADTIGGTMTFRGVLTDPQYRIVMHALQTELKGRLLSEPNVTTISNEPARLIVAEEYPYPTDWASVTSTVTNDGVTSSNTTAFVPTDFETENVGITLDVMPSVGSDLETIILELHPQIVSRDPNKDAKYNIISNDANGDPQAFEVTRPTFSRQEIMAKVVIRSGETVVLGGLISEEDVIDVSKVPILGDIPGLGALFRRTVKTKSRSNLLIFVTAEIVDTRGRFYHPSDSKAGTSDGRDIMPDFVPSATPNGNRSSDILPDGNGGGTGTENGNNGNTKPEIKPNADGTEAPARYDRNNEKTRPEIVVDRPKPPRIGRKK